MRTQQRLTEAYENARIEPLDSSSRYVFMSDCHRGDGSHSDEFLKNENIYLRALDHYYENGFTYVEAGDGDELWEHPQFRHIKNAHYDVFESIQRFHEQDRLILIYGNHNLYLRDPSYVQANYHTYYDDYREMAFDFLPGVEPCEALVLKHTETAQEVLVIHGHQGDFANDQGWILTMFTMKYFWRYMHAFGVKNPASPTKNAAKRHKIEKNFNKWIDRHRMMLICGHTHRFKYPKSYELPYFNTGSCIYPASVIALEIEHGDVRLARWRTLVDVDGALRVTREVIRGPRPISAFDIRLA